MPKPVKVVTALTDAEHEDFVPFLKASCNFHNFDLIVLQENGGYTSHRIKDRMLYAYLRGIDDDEVILFSDAYDAFFVSNGDEALKKFLAFDAPLVFSAELNCWPCQKIQKDYPPSSHHFKYLNCGAFIGYAWFLKDIYKKYINVSFGGTGWDWSNQYKWHHIYLRNRKTIRIDHNCELFYNTSMPMDRSLLVTGDKAADHYLLEEELERLGKEISFVGNRVRYNHKGTLPVHIHFPGQISKWIMKGEYFDAVKCWAI